MSIACATSFCSAVNVKSLLLAEASLGAGFTPAVVIAGRTGARETVVVGTFRGGTLFSPTFVVTGLTAPGRDLSLASTSRFFMTLVSSASSEARASVAEDSLLLLCFRGMSGARRSSIDVSSSAGGGGAGFSEDRERKVFCEALKDGFVLCQCVHPKSPLFHSIPPLLKTHISFFLFFLD